MGRTFLVSEVLKIISKFAEVAFIIAYWLLKRYLISFDRLRKWYKNLNATPPIFMRGIIWNFEWHFIIFQAQCDTELKSLNLLNGRSTCGWPEKKRIHEIIYSDIIIKFEHI